MSNAKSKQSKKFLEAARAAGIDDDVDIDEVLKRLAAQERPSDRTLRGQKKPPPKDQKPE